MQYWVKNYWGLQGPGVELRGDDGGWGVVRDMGGLGCDGR